MCCEVKLQRPIDENKMSKKTGPSHRLTFEEAVEVHKMIATGMLQSRIAAHFDVNSGRIAEVNTGKLHPGSREVAFGRSKAA